MLKKKRWDIMAHKGHVEGTSKEKAARRLPTSTGRRRRHVFAALKFMRCAAFCAFPELKQHSRLDVQSFVCYKML